MQLATLIKQHYKPVIVAIALAVLYRNVLGELILDWWNNPDYSHGLVLPFVCLYLLWRQRAKWASTPEAPNNLGLLVMAGALGLLFLGELGAEFFIMRMSLLIFVAGTILFFVGWKHLRIAAFPIALLILAIPLPAVIFYQLTFPLQLIASQLGAFFLETLKVPVLREGNMIVLPSITLEVVEACSGIRSLFTLATLTIVYAYFMEDRAFVRVLIVAFSVPLALFSNGLRIMGTGLLTQYVNPEAAEGFFHTFSGWFIFMTSLIVLFGLHRGLNLLRRS